MTRNLVLTEDDEKKGEIIAHHLECPVVQEHRAQGRYLATLIGIQKPLPSHVKQHKCLS